MTTEIIKAEDYGIKEKQEKELLSNLPQIKKERSEFEKQYDEIIKMDIEDPETWLKARNLRLKIKDNRTKGINVWHKNAKDFFLRGGQFVDAIKRKEIAVNERMEEALSEIENYEEIVKQKEINRLNGLRTKEIEPYSEFIPFGISLGELPEEEYQKVLNGAKLQFEAEQERLRKEEEKRLEKIRIEKLHNERKDELRDVWDFVELKGINYGELKDEDFEQLKVNSEAAKNDYLKEQERIRKENERLEEERKKALAAQKDAQEKARKEREKLEAKAKKEREAAQKKLDAERKERERIEAELKAKKEKEEAEAKAKEEARRKAEAAPDKEKLTVFLNEFRSMEFPTLKTEVANKAMENFKILMAKSEKYLEEQIGKL